MSVALLGLLAVVGGGVLSLLTTFRPRVCNAVGPASAVAGCAIALIPVVDVIATGTSRSLGPLEWHVPYGSFALELDPLSAWFALPILGLSALAAIYGHGYMGAYAGKKPLGPHWFFFSLMIAGMMMVVVSRNGVLFLVSWEVMSLASYFLVTFDHEEAHVRYAGRVYLIATHLGTACLLAMFALLGNHAGSLDFVQISAAGSMPSSLANALFVLALIGFGTKAGFFPLHVWLPEAHPAAPSHVSALMSGVMIKTGIFGIVMTLRFLGPPPLWWGWLLISIGVASAVMGILYALSQHELKRLLAYSSVENIGIIAIGLGIGVLGLGLGRPRMATLGFAGALLHVLNHAAFKGLLFLSAGAVIRGTGTGDLGALGGLQTRMPFTAIAFLTGALAVAGLPPLNGFLSEFILYLVSIEQVLEPGAAGSAAAIVSIGALAFVGGLAAICFTKAYGIVFLGNPRSERARHAHTPTALMCVPMFVLAGACLLIGLTGPVVVRWMQTVLVDVTGETAASVSGQLRTATAPMYFVVLVGAGSLAVVLALALLRRWLLHGRDVTEGVTWDCGYAAPSARMQYTSSSYAQPTAQFFGEVLRTRRDVNPALGLFPKPASLQTTTSDAAMVSGYRPLFLTVRSLLVRLHWIQVGRLNYYVMYIALTIVALLAWFMLGSP